MGYTSETRESLPTKIWAMVTPQSMAGVSEKMVSVAAALSLCGMLKAGNLDLKCFLCYCPLSGIFKGFLDGINPTKVKF